MTDNDGKRCKMIMKDNKIIIKATYYSRKKDYKSAYKAVNFWNKQIGKTYTDKNGKNYQVEFQLTLKVTSTPQIDAALDKSKEGNSYEIVEDLG